MTEAQAHLWVACWDQKIFRRRAQTESKAIRRLQKLAGGVLLASVIGIGIAGHHVNDSDSYFPLVLWFFSLAPAVLSVWLLSHVFEAREALEKSEIANRKS